MAEVSIFEWQFVRVDFTSVTKILLAGEDINAGTQGHFSAMMDQFIDFALKDMKECSHEHLNPGACSARYIYRYQPRDRTGVWCSAKPEINVCPLYTPLDLQLR